MIVRDFNKIRFFNLRLPALTNIIGLPCHCLSETTKLLYIKGNGTGLVYSSFFFTEDQRKGEKIGGMDGVIDKWMDFYCI